MLIRTVMMSLSLALGANSLWAPTVASMESRDATIQWQDAQQFARQYRAALRSDSVRLTDSLAYQIVRTADHYGVERRVAFGLVWTESRFKVDARGKVGDVGLAQVLPSTGRRVCGIRTVRELYEPGRNLDCGFKFYAQLLERYGAVDWLALVAYNRGPRIADSIRAQGHTRSPSTTPTRN